MKRIVVFWSILTLFSSSLSLAQTARPEILNRAILRAGGREALEASPVLEWRGTATIHIPDRTIQIAGEWEVRPDSAVVASWPLEQPASTRRLILSQGGGWTQRGSDAPAPMSRELLIEERHQFYLYCLLRLVPLLDPAFTVEPAPPDSLGRALKVSHPAHPDVILYFDREDRIAGLRTVFAAEDMSQPQSQEIRFTGSVDSRGVSWFREMTIRRAGQPYFDLRITDFRASPGR